MERTLTGADLDARDHYNQGRQPLPPPSSPSTNDDDRRYWQDMIRRQTKIAMRNLRHQLQALIREC